MKEQDVVKVVDFIDSVLMNHADESKVAAISKEVNALMATFPLYK